MVDGRIVAGEFVRLACQRHLLDVERGPGRGLFFDAKAADRVLRFFPQVLRHSKGEWGGKPVDLEPWQQFRLASVFGWKRKDTGMRRFRRAYNTVGRKNGKALAIDTLVPTPGGFRRMLDLRSGDEVFDETGLPTRVSWVSEVMLGRPCYEVEFSTGERVVADADHLWLTSARRGDTRNVGGRRGRKVRASSVKTTSEIAASLDYAPAERREARALDRLGDTLIDPDRVDDLLRLVAGIGLTRTRGTPACPPAGALVCVHVAFCSDRHPAGVVGALPVEGVRAGDAARG